MGSFNLFALRRNAGLAVRNALAAFACAIAAALVCGAIWNTGGERRGVATGLFTAWLVSSLGAAAITVGQGVCARAFWWAFGAGMAARLLTLVGLTVFSVSHPGLSQPALLLSYALGVSAFLLIEYRRPD